MFAFITIACLLGAAAAAPSAIGGIGLGGIGGVAVGSVDIPRYGFNYAVSDPVTGDNKQQSEVRDGGVVRGSYSLAEPDGTIRVVNYAADPATGFNAVVKRVGAAVHPQQLIVQKAIAPIAVAAPIATVGIPSSHIGLGSGIGLGVNHIGLAGIPGIGLGGIGLGGHGAIGLGLGAHGVSGLGLGAHGVSGLGLGAHGVSGLGLGAHGVSGLGLGGLGLVDGVGLGGLGLKG